jgi:D-alanyl-lipoteichoic acid acyltransferase DltB (MBOAT superfamily)
MLFNSYEFIFAFLPVAFALYFLLLQFGRGNAASIALIGCSLFFYSWWNVIYLPLIVLSICTNFLIGSKICSSFDTVGVKRKPLLILGILFNLSLLAYFKYADFFVENVNYLSASNLPTLNIVLPLAISFFTFQQIAYLVDSYRGEVKQPDYITYTTFVCFFPQLIAGPIVHYKEMIPQFESSANRRINFNNISLGVFLFSIGLFKKVVIADTFAVWASTGFDVASTLQFVEAWITALSYTFQLYFDFSGYTDMALGIALLFNIRLPQNFNSPYKAKDLQDFWRRWHITLSRFLRDYVYVPLGGNRNGNWQTYSNLLITFLLGGLWHGAGWPFIFWGLMHGIGLCIHRLWRAVGFQLWSFLAWAITFLYVVVAWVFFRAENLTAAGKVLSGMAGINGVRLPEIFAQKFPILRNTGLQFGDSVVNINGNWNTLVWVFVGLLAVLFLTNSMQMSAKFKPSYANLVFTTVLSCVSILMLSNISEFLYFNF